MLSSRSVTRILIATTAFAATHARGETASSRSTWIGSGTRYVGAMEEPYSVVLERTVVSEKSIVLAISVNSEPHGIEIFRDRCTQSLDSGSIERTAALVTPKRWRTVCESGRSGAGAMFEHGVGIEYMTGADGIAWSTSVVIDTEASLRLLRTELRDGKAQAFFVETMRKQ